MCSDPPQDGCPFGRELKQIIIALQETVAKVDLSGVKDRSDIWKGVNNLQYRLPVWATMLIAVLLAAVAALSVAAIR